MAACPMNVVKATARYEDWLRTHTRLIEGDLRLKHTKMAESLFSFLRATFYRWAQTWPQVCSDLAAAPKILAVGDLHVENFGTWRDIEGRLIWGVNDFDEAGSLSYTNDLVRLATSVLLAGEEKRLAVSGKDACAEILDGYSKSMAEAGQPFVLEEGNKWLRSIALNELRDPDRFWKKMDDLPTLRGEISASARDAIEHLMPQPRLHYRLARRVAGLGSLGRERFVAIVEFHGAKIAREAQATRSVRSFLGPRSNPPRRHLVPVAAVSCGTLPGPIRASAWSLDRPAPLTALLAYRLGCSAA